MIVACEECEGDQLVMHSYLMIIPGNLIATYEGVSDHLLGEAAATEGEDCAGRERGNSTTISCSARARRSLKEGGDAVEEEEDPSAEVDAD